MIEISLISLTFLIISFTSDLTEYHYSHSKLYGQLRIFQGLCKPQVNFEWHNYNYTCICWNHIMNWIYNFTETFQCKNLYTYICRHAYYIFRKKRHKIDISDDPNIMEFSFSGCHFGASCACLWSWEMTIFGSHFNKNVMLVFAEKKNLMIVWIKNTKHLVNLFQTLF